MCEGQPAPFQIEEVISCVRVGSSFRFLPGLFGVAVAFVDFQILKHGSPPLGPTPTDQEVCRLHVTV